MRALLACALVVAGCGGEIDPCGGVGPVCIGLHVFGDVSADSLRVSVDRPQPASMTTRDPAGAIHFPVRFSVQLPDGTPGPIAVTVDALLGEGVVATATRSVALTPPGYGSADLTLAAIGSPDLAAGDLASSDLAIGDLAAGDRAILDGPATADASTDLAQPFDLGGTDLSGTAILSVSVAGMGSGTVQVSGVPCVASRAGSCTTAVPKGTMVTLAATPGPTSTLLGFSSSCFGNPCTFPVVADTFMTVTFDATVHQLYVDKIEMSGAAGTVAITTNSFSSCGTGCYQIPIGNSVMLSGSTMTPNMSFLGFGGTCSGTSPCTFAMNDDYGVTASFGPTDINRAFVTSVALDGAGVMSLSHADSLCAAAAGSLPNASAYKAWLSDGAATPASRFGAASGWVRIDGLPVLGALSSLNAIFYPIDVGATGAPYSGAVWTGIDADGAPDANTCSGWTNNSSGTFAMSGTAGLEGGAWTAGSVIACNQTAVLYCFGATTTQSSFPINVTATPRRAFLSKSLFTPSSGASGGISGADQLCANDATNAGLTGTYQALLGTDGAQPLARFDLGKPPWARLDGTLLAADAPSTIGANALAALDQLSDGSYVSSATTIVWLGDGRGTCANWTDSTAVGANATAVAPIALGSARACGMALPVYCLQQ